MEETETPPPPTPRTQAAALVFINWNSADLTCNAVASVRRQAVSPERFRILVVDNGSGDDSLARLARDLPEAEVIALPENRGFAAAVNAGLERVTEPYAFILNTDITLENDAFTLLIKALTQDPRAALACPLLLRPDGSVQASAVPEPRLWWELLNRALPRHFIRLAPDEPTAVPGVVGPCMAIDVQRMATVGRMDERFFFFMEETDWCRRIRRAGLHILYVPSARVVHLQGASANRRPIKARIQFYDSRYRYFRKHTGRLGVGVLYLGLWLRLTLDLLLHSLLCALTLGRQRHRDRVAVYAALWGWHALLCRPRWGIDPRPLR